MCAATGQSGAATGQSGAEITTDYCPTLNCNHEAPYVAFGLLTPCGFCGYAFDESTLGRYGCPNCEGEVIDVQCATGQVTHTLKADGVDASEDGTGRGTPIVPWATGVTIHGTDGCKSIASFSDTAQCLRARTPGLLDNSSTTIVAFQSSQSGVRLNEVHATLDSNNCPRRHNGALVGMQVRRLTPTECERLQGFPDGHTAITVRGKPAADGPRYKSLGNSMAVPVMAWIGKQIDDVVMFY